MTKLGWKPRHRDIRAVVASAWNWHETHPDGYAEGASTGEGRAAKS
jgi:UDP-glucose 4-epimerase